MQQAIMAYHQDEERHWVAQLTCGHVQHVRHDPPWTVREWVTTDLGRQQHLGMLLSCKKCDREEAVDAI